MFKPDQLVVHVHTEFIFTLAVKEFLFIFIIFIGKVLFLEYVLNCRYKMKIFDLDIWNNVAKERNATCSSLNVLLEKP